MENSDRLPEEKPTEMVPKSPNMATNFLKYWKFFEPFSGLWLTPPHCGLKVMTKNIQNAHHIWDGLSAGFV